MNNVSKTILTIAVAGSLLFSGAIVSQATDNFSKTEDSRDANSRTHQPFGDKTLPDDEELPGVNHDSCMVTGYISSLEGDYQAGKLTLRIKSYNSPMTNKYYVTIGSDFHKTIGWDLPKEAWLQHMGVRAKSHDGICEDTGIHTKDGGRLDYLKVWDED